MAQADDLLSEPPDIQPVDVLAEKLPWLTRPRPRRSLTIAPTVAKPV